MRQVWQLLVRVEHTQTDLDDSYHNRHCCRAAAAASVAVIIQFAFVCLASYERHTNTKLTAKGTTRQTANNWRHFITTF